MVGPAAAKSSSDNEPIQGTLVREELERLCVDKLFRDTTRMKRFLRYVVEETLAGRGKLLKGYVIGVEVFDRPDDFDPQADTIVRVQAGQLRRRLDLYYANSGRSAAVRILIPRGRYAPIFEFRKNPEADENIDPNTVIPQNESKSRDPRPSLAVLTLDDLSSQNYENGQYFAEGLSAEIVNALVQFRSLRIVTLTPSVSTSLAKKSVRDIGQECGADFVLSGSVRRDGEVFRVTVSLIRCETGEHVFSRVFDREYKPGSLFSLQEEIASYTAASIAAPFGAINRYNRRSLDGRQSSMAAYNCVMRYYDIKLSPTRHTAEELLKEVEKVTTNQPNFSMGWVIRALINNFLAIQAQSIEDVKHYLIEGDRTARRALSVDSQNALGYFALYQSFFHRGVFDEADRMIRRTLSLNPNDYSVLAYYAICLAARGNLELASSMGAAALRLIGRAPTWYYVPQMMVDFSNANYESAAGLVGQGLEDVPYAFYLMGLSAKAHLGEINEARRGIERILNKNPDYARRSSAVLELWHLSPEFARKVDVGLTLAGLDIDALKSSI